MPKTRSYSWRGLNKDQCSIQRCILVVAERRSCVKMYPIRKDLVGKRFMCVPDKTTQNGRPNSRSNRSTNPLDYTWKCGIIRACTEEDSNNIDQKVLCMNKWQYNVVRIGFFIWLLICKTNRLFLLLWNDFSRYITCYTCTISPL